jgi:hypothetical protein
MRNNIGKSHYEQLMSYAGARDREGWYYGNKSQFEKRHLQILKFLNEAIMKCEKNGTQSQ